MGQHILEARATIGLTPLVGCGGVEAETDVVGDPVAVSVAEDGFEQGDGVVERDGAVVF